MSVISIYIAKAYLDVIHDADDVKLQMLLDGAEDEALQFCDCTVEELKTPADEISSEAASETSSESESELPSSFILGVMLLLQAMYQATPADAVILRKSAEIKLMPHRKRLGV